MGIELTLQQQALDAMGSAPARVIDLRTRATYVLVPEDEYEDILADERELREWHQMSLRKRCPADGRSAVTSPGEI